MTSWSSAPRLALLFAALSLAACATLADSAMPPPPPVRIPVAEPAPGSEPEEAPSDELVGPRFGGTGGSSARVRCPFANGLHGQSGKFIDRVGLVCFLAERSWESPAYGGTGGGRFQKLCPPGSRAAGIFGRSGENIDQLGLLCSDSAGQPSVSDLQGGHGGGAFQWVCPTGYALIGLDLMTGDYVDSVAPVCSRR